MQKGDLIYIPSETSIYQLDPEISGSRRIKRTSKLQEPKSFLLLEIIPRDFLFDYLKILVSGEEWYVKRKDAKKIESWES